MSQHRKAKKVLKEFLACKNSFNQEEVKAIIDLEISVTNLEQMMEVFIPKNFLKNELSQLTK